MAGPGGRPFEAALAVFAANPRLGVFTLAVPPRAGGEVSAHYRRTLDRALEELLDGMPADQVIGMPPPAVRQSLIGGAVSLIVARIEAGEGDRVGDLLPDLVELFLTPFIGHGEAARAARATPER